MNSASVEIFCLFQERYSADQLKLACFAVPGSLLGGSLLALMLPGCEAEAPQKKQQAADFQNKAVVARHATAQRTPT